MPVFYIKKFIRKYILPVICVLFIFHKPAYSQALQFDGLDIKKNILQVADHYAHTGEYHNAILQYYEYLYRFPQDTLIPNITIRIATVYRKSGKMKLAEDYYRQAVEKFPHTKYDLENRLRLGAFLYEKGDYEGAITYALSQKEDPFRLIEIYSLIRLEEIDIVDSLVGQFPSEKFPTEIVPEYINYRDCEAVLNWKKEWGAYALSAVFPGGGRILIEEYRDGVLTVVGFWGMVKVAAYAFKYHPAFYYYTATGALIYYGLNLYSTYFSVQRYSDSVMKQSLNSLTEIYPLSGQLRLESPF
jgi:hypothetical protein